MPTYEYKCTACGHAFEQFQSMSAEPVKKCPQCGKSKVKRLLGTGAGIIFKGSGFYITDYRPDSYNQAAKADNSGGGGGGGESKNGDAAKAAAGSSSSSDAAPATPAKADKPAAAKPSAPKKESKSPRK